MNRATLFLTVFALVATGSSCLSTTSGPPKAHPLVVHNGTGDGKFMAGEEVDIAANVPSGYVFLRWMSIEGGGHIQRFSSDTKFTMPDKAATIAAVFGKIESWFPPGPEGGTKGILLPKNPEAASQFRMEQKIRVTLDIGEANGDLSASDVWDQIGVTADWFPGSEAIETWYSIKLVKYFDKKELGTEILRAGAVPKSAFGESTSGTYEASIWYEGAWTLTEAATKEDGDGNLIRPEVSTAMNLVIHGKGFATTRTIASGFLLPVEVNVTNLGSSMLNPAGWRAQNTGGGQLCSWLFRTKARIPAIQGLQVQVGIVRDVKYTAKIKYEDGSESICQTSGFMPDSLYPNFQPPIVDGQTFVSDDNPGMATTPRETPYVIEVSDIFEARDFIVIKIGNETPVTIAQVNWSYSNKAIGHTPEMSTPQHHRATVILDGPQLPRPATGAILHGGPVEDQPITLNRNPRAAFDFLDANGNWQAIGSAASMAHTYSRNP